MKQFLQKKAKLVFLCMLVLLTCTACANPRGRDGKTLADQIIASEETTIDASQINYKDVEDLRSISRRFSIFFLARNPYISSRCSVTF